MKSELEQVRERKKKRCSKCGQEKDLESGFRVNVAASDYRASWCRACETLQAKKRYRQKKAEYEKAFKKGKTGGK
jgi:hypothetical protein